MTKLFTSYHLWEASMLKESLEQHGIDCVIRNEQLANTLRPIIPDMWPELWVLHDTDAERAAQLMQEWEKTHADSDETNVWTCAHCGETIEGEFDACWNCQEARPR